mgnify:CR=1 FL=1
MRETLLQLIPVIKRGCDVKISTPKVELNNILFSENKLCGFGINELNQSRYPYRNATGEPFFNNNDLVNNPIYVSRFGSVLLACNPYKTIYINYTGFGYSPIEYPYPYGINTTCNYNNKLVIGGINFEPTTDFYENYKNTVNDNSITNKNKATQSTLFVFQQRDIQTPFIEALLILFGSCSTFTYETTKEYLLSLIEGNGIIIKEPAIGNILALFEMDNNLYVFGEQGYIIYNNNLEEIYRNNLLKLFNRVSATKDENYIYAINDKKELFVIKGEPKKICSLNKNIYDIMITITNGILFINHSSGCYTFKDNILTGNHDFNCYEIYSDTMYGKQLNPNPTRKIKIENISIPFSGYKHIDKLLIVGNKALNYTNINDLSISILNDENACFPNISVQNTINKIEILKDNIDLTDNFSISEINLSMQFEDVRYYENISAIIRTEQEN